MPVVRAVIGEHKFKPTFTVANMTMDSIEKWLEDLA